MFGRRRTHSALRAELAEVETLIAAHPLASARIRAAHDVVADGRSVDPTEVDRRLADDGLPGTEELGRVQLAGLWSWWKLHRRKRKLEHRVGRADGR